MAKHGIMGLKIYVCNSIPEDQIFILGAKQTVTDFSNLMHGSKYYTIEFDLNKCAVIDLKEKTS